MQTEQLAVLHSAGLYGVGGAEISFQSVFESSELPGLRQAMVLTRKPHDAFRDLGNDDIYRIFGYSFYDRRDQGFGRGDIAKAWAQALRQHRPDVVLFWNELPPRKIRWLIRTFCPKARLVLYERGKSWRRPESRETTARLNALDAVIANSEASKAVLRIKHGATLPIHVVRNPIPYDRIPKDAIVRELPQSRPLRLGFAGRLVSGKGLSTVISGLAVLRERGFACELWIAGSGPARAQLQAQARQEGVAQYCKWLGQVGDMPEFYQRVDIVVVPSVHEAFGLVSVEAQSWGVPVVVSRVDGLPETIVEGRTGVSVVPSVDIDDEHRNNWQGGDLPGKVVDPETGSLVYPRLLSADDVAGAVEGMVVNEEVYLDMSGAASRYALLNFAWRLYAERFQQALASIAAIRN